MVAGKHFRLGQLRDDVLTGEVPQMLDVDDTTPSQLRGTKPSALQKVVNAALADAERLSDFRPTEKDLFHVLLRFVGGEGWGRAVYTASNGGMNDAEPAQAGVCCLYRQGNGFGR